MSGTGAKPRQAKRRPQKKKAAAKAKPKKRAGPLSMYPLDFDTALRGLLAVASAEPKKPA